MPCHNAGECDYWGIFFKMLPHTPSQIFMMFLCMYSNFQLMQRRKIVLLCCITLCGKHPACDD